VDSQRIAAEFGLGLLLSAEQLAPGHPDVVKLVTASGTFVAKPALHDAAPALYERVALVLNGAGLRQARPVRTTAGELVSESGHTVQEFLPGQAGSHPTRTQTLATMQHLAAYHTALAQVPVPASLREEDSVWTRVSAADYLVAELPGLLRQLDPPAAERGMLTKALERLAASLPLIRSLPRQLVHADIGPDNVLMQGDDVVAVIDFTPAEQPVLFAIASAVYWYHVYGHGELDPAVIRASLAAAGPWTDAELEAWPAMLIQEALRRLATPLALAAEGAEAGPAGEQVPASAAARLHAALLIIRPYHPALSSGPKQPG
jgi:Ser/Thr protein kinase RdoA (MazF antagonist)